MSKHIKVSTAYEGEHRDWTIEQEEMLDAAMFRSAVEELFFYAADRDANISPGGSFIEQIEAAIDATWKDGKQRNLTLPTQDVSRDDEGEEAGFIDADFEVFVRREDD